MSMAAQPEFTAEVIRLGAAQSRACFNCGNCSAICPLAETDSFYPRRLLRYAQLGAGEKILASPGIWLCYHCGQCTSMCPRLADPGEVIMALRRWAIARYSWPRPAGKLYTSKMFTFFFYLSAAVFFGLGLVLFHGPVDRETVRLSLFIPTRLIEVGGVGLGCFVLGCVALSLRRMYRHLTTAAPVPVRLGAGDVWRTFLEEVLIQQRYRQCEDKTRRWMHLAIVNGFIALGLTTALAFIFNSGGAPENLPAPIRGLGTLGGIALLGGALVAGWRRLAGREVFTHFTDWTFLTLLFLAGLTGLLLEGTAYLNLPPASYTLYAAHLVVVALLILAAPCTKFAHAAYRFLALCVARAQTRAQSGK
ncbi:MAG: 4Fe-4S dicluster domain-containing protein [Thermoanaerobacterales bacterium]|nr:4Fe-4S dicluster domain-containing protein [Thermoanaerobacterales bacterium]